MFPRKIILEGRRALHLSPDFMAGLLTLYCTSRPAPQLSSIVSFVGTEYLVVIHNKYASISGSLVGVGSVDAARLTARLR